MADELLVKIVSRHVEAIDIVSLELEAEGAESLPAFSAGSHIDVHVGPGLVRQYSLCNTGQAGGAYRIAVLRDPKSRGGSIAVHDELKVGQVIKISAPRNHFELVPSTKAILFAGGIGITPILSMAERLIASDIDFELHYCSRSADRMAFYAQLCQSTYASRVHFHFDDGPATQRLSTAQVLASPADGVHLYVCGPAGFIDHVVETAKSNAWDAKNVHFEHFSNANLVQTGDQTFEVVIASSGRRITVQPEQSVASALVAAHVEIPMSCEQGVCGTCITRVISGTPDHRDMYFTDAEKAKNDQFTPCCSRSKTPVLVLDL